MTEEQQEQPVDSPEAVQSQDTGDEEPDELVGEEANGDDLGFDPSSFEAEDEDSEEAEDQ